MTLQDSDSFITQRGSDLYQVESQVLMNKMQDDDLLLVSRERANYKVSWSEVKDDLGGGGGNSIYPNTNDITTTPPVLGSGTELDPYVLSAQTSAPYGGSAFTEETITIDSQAPNTAVKWTVTSDADGRFNQPEGITDANGDWSGKLQYLDNPVSLVDTTYEGLFQIGLVYFQWTVNQKEVSSIPPALTNVSLVESSPAEGDRFTSQSFVASSQVTEGEPLSEKTFDAHVDGTLTKQVKFDEPLLSSTFDASGAWSLDWRFDAQSTDATRRERIAYNNGWVAINRSGTSTTQIQWSTGGALWTTARNTGEDLKDVTYGIVDASSGAGKFVVLGGTKIWWSSAGSSGWNEVGVTEGGWQAITFGGGLFCAIGSSGTQRVMYSPDAINWSTSPPGDYAAWTSIAYGNGRFVALTHDDTTENDVTYSSIDTATGWGSTKTGNNGGWAAITFGRGKFVAIGNGKGNKNIGYSEDGINWTLVDHESEILYNTIAYSDPAGGVFLAGSTDDRADNLMWSIDGITWTVASHPNSGNNGNGIFAISGGGSDGFIAVGYSAFSSLTGKGESTTLSFESDADMEGVAAGDAVSQGSTSGTVGAVTDTTVDLSSSSGTWANGVDVVGPQKTIVEDNARLYCAFDTNGNITDLLSTPQDPPYTTTDTNPGLTFTFPATLPSGQTPDDELPDGTTFTVDVKAENVSGTSGPVSATVQPEQGTPDAPLAGLTTLYTGNVGTPLTIVTGVDLVNNEGLLWIKNRSGNVDHQLLDTLRGNESYLVSNGSSPAANSTVRVTSFNDNGFSVGPGGSDVNDNTDNYVAWSFGKSEKYFDVVKFTGTGSGNNIVSHNLGAIPGMIIYKNTEASQNWIVYHSALGADKKLTLNKSDLAIDANGSFGNPPTAPSATEFTARADGNNEAGKEIIAYLFAEDTPGVIKCGGYSGTGADQFIQTGFEPQWILTKTATSPSGADDRYTSWRIRDSKQVDWGKTLRPNLEGQEDGDGVFTVTDTGFTVTSNVSKSGETYIYVAIAAPPAARSQTNEEFVESQAKFLTYDNRKQVRQGEEALDDREAVIKQAADLGLTKEQINEVFNNG